MDDQTRKSELEKTLRKFTLDKLEAFGTILGYQEQVISTTTISGMLSKEGRGLGGTLSSFARTTVDNEPLLVQVGKDPGEGQLWKFNEKVVPKWEAKSLADQILEENKSYRMAKDKTEAS